MPNRVAKALPYLFLAPAVLPLVYVDGLLYPYLSLKTILVRGLGLLLIAAILYLILSARQLYWDRLRAKTTWIPVALLATAYAASIFGVNFYHSFWSVFDRGDGLLTLSILVAYFYAALLAMDRTLFMRFARIVAWVGSLVALYAILQWLQATLHINIPIIAEPNGRYGSTLGNAAFLAAYLGMTFFLTLIAARMSRGKWKTMAYIGAAAQILGILISATRGTILALVVAAFLASFYFAWKGMGRTRALARGGILGLLMLAGIFFAFRGPLAHAPFEPIRRIASISLRDATVSSRVFLWRNILQESVKKPILGYGAEHIEVVFNRFYDPTKIEEQWFDRSHNVYLDYLLQYGVVGLTLYLALLLAFAWRAWKWFQAEDSTGGFLLLFLITYGIQNFFVFDTASTLWLLFVCFAWVLIGTSETKETKMVMPKWWPNWASIVVGVAIALLIIPVSIQPLRANIALAQGYLYHIADVRRATERMKAGLALDTYADLEYGYQLYEMYTERQVTMLSGEGRVIAYRFAADTLSKNFEKYPYDARTAVYYAHVLDSAPPEISIDEAALRAAIDRAIALSPKRIQPWYLLANISLRKADQMQPGSERTALYKDGIATLEEFAGLVPDLAEPRYAVATLYLTIGDKASAKKWADEALPLYTTDLAVAKRAARYYIAVEDWPNAVRFMEDVVHDEPDNLPQQYDLAKAKWLAGDKAGAREIVEKLKTDAPGLFESDPNFIKEYNAAK